MNLSKRSEDKELFSLAYASENNDEILLSLEFFSLFSFNNFIFFFLHIMSINVINHFM
jgi:hypothetical protein